ncbi:hypothetical protein [Scopulibacillus cellulosilyticus]|uniref:Uncharacterized protein n=1 Tax=Scopulibacillus cellulosilyticus TaxID=2665665 RepID=A0ABW2PT88_9BACL
MNKQKANQNKVPADKVNHIPDKVRNKIIDMNQDEMAKRMTKRPQ